MWEVLSNTLDKMIARTAQVQAAKKAEEDGLNGMQLDDAEEEDVWMCICDLLRAHTLRVFLR